MKILQVLPELVTGGVERGTIDIARALVEAGHEAFVMSNGGPLVEQLNELGARHIPLPVHSKNPFIIRRNAHRINALVDALNIDLIHARSRAPAWSCYWASRWSNTPFVTTFHGTYGSQNALKRWYNRVMCRSDKTIAVSGFIKQHIQEVYGTPEKQLQVIHRGIDMSLFDPKAIEAEAIEQLKQHWNLDATKQTIVLPGRLTRWKGQLDFIDAIAQLNRKDIQCLIVGSDQGREAYNQELLERIKGHHLKHVISLCGHHSNMAEVYALADIVVSASKQPEAFGRVACEAQAMGCLVVATQHGGAKETIAPEQGDWQCQPHNPASLAGALNMALSQNSPELSHIQTDSRDYIQTHFSLDRMCRDTLALYAALIK